MLTFLPRKSVLICGIAVSTNFVDVVALSSTGNVDRDRLRYYTEGLESHENKHEEGSVFRNVLDGMQKPRELTMPSSDDGELSAFNMIQNTMVGFVLLMLYVI